LGNNQNVEELERRKIRALIRDAGTSIRKAELDRQIMNAELNIEVALCIQKNIHKDIEIAMEPIQKAIKEGERTYHLDDEDEDMLLNSLSVLIKEGGIALTKLPPGTIPRHVKELNELTSSVLNNIISDLNREGIYLPKFNHINPDGFFITVLTEARDQADRAVGFLNGMIKKK
jgi:hypothetical protein